MTGAAMTDVGMPVLLGVAHGSKDEASQQTVRDLLAAAERLRPGLRALPAYIDNASPSIAAAVEGLVRDGVTDIAVVPLLLTPASHSKTDVAGSVQAARATYAGVRFRYGRPLGPHPVLVDVLAQRLTEAGVTPRDPVVLVANGALDPDANAQVAATARLLFERGGYASVDIAFASATKPTLPEALDRLRRLGTSRAAVAQYFLGPGRLPTAMEKKAVTAGLDVVVAQPLGAHDAIAALILERYDEAIAGDIRMNCDACLYRIPFPGLETKVGAPQLAHTHPDDADRSVYAAAGGMAGLERLAAAWHARVMADEVVSHAFSHGFDAHHVERLAAYWAEALGGPPAYTQSYGDETAVVRMHSGNGEHEEMDQRAVACFDQALTDAGFTDDQPVRGVLRDYFAWATFTSVSRFPSSPDDVPSGLRIPQWSWAGLVDAAV
jgi:sirohydrochlorin ferrochelatase/truncated hemoglobin YjbI